MLEIAGGNKCNYEMQPCKTWSGAGWTPAKARRGPGITRTDLNQDVSWRALIRAVRRSNPARAFEFPRAGPALPRLKSAAPRKRSMVAWRRRP